MHMRTRIKMMTSYVMHNTISNTVIVTETHQLNTKYITLLTSPRHGADRSPVARLHDDEGKYFPKIPMKCDRDEVDLIQSQGLGTQRR